MTAKPLAEIEPFDGAILPPPTEADFAFIDDCGGFTVYTDADGRHWMRTEALQLDPRNARKHKQASVHEIAKSLKAYGHQKPAAVRRSDRVVLAGNGYLLACQLIGAPFIRVTLSDLQGHAATAYALADNRTTEFSEWNWEEAANQFEELDAAGFDLSLTAFPAYEIEPLLAKKLEEQDQEEDDEADKKALPKGNKQKGARILIELKDETLAYFNWAKARLEEQRGVSLNQEEVLHAVIAQWIADEKAAQAATTEEPVKP